MNKIVLDAIANFLMADEYRRCTRYTVEGYYGFAYVTVHYADKDVKYKVVANEDGDVDFDQVP